ncbi:MAG: hypothetical protein ACRDGM_15035 [bacterium]
MTARQRCALVVSAVLILGACAGKQIPPSPHPPYTVSVSANRDDVFQAILRELTSRNLRIVSADRPSGLISVGIQFQPKDYDCGHYEGSREVIFSPLGVTLQFFVDGHDQGTHVRVHAAVGRVYHETRDSLGFLFIGWLWGDRTRWFGFTEFECQSRHDVEAEIISAARRRIQ